MKRRSFAETGYKLDSRPETYAREIHEETRCTETEESTVAIVRTQDIPHGVKHQRSPLQDFYTAWKKEKIRL
jgi:hypothetical protein